MLFTAIIHPCNTRKQRDFAHALDRAFNNIDFADGERLERSVRALADMYGLHTLTTDMRKNVLSVALDGQVVSTWLPLNTVVNN